MTELRRGTAAALERWILRRTRPMPEEALSRDCVVVAPHQDDETLGCGGTIVRKRRLGAHVTIVFLTDGSRSHPCMGRERMREIRECEAMEAARILGIGSSDVVFLRFEDSRLMGCEAEATAALARVLRDRGPRQVFVPHRRDVFADHIAANRVGRAAARGSCVGAEVVEYPVWLWRHWPWVAGRWKTAREGAAFWVRSAERAAVLLRDCRERVEVGEVAGVKRAALAAHRSQVERLGKGWQVLADIDGGDFLDRLMGKVELFSCSGQHGDNADRAAGAACDLDG